MMNVLWRGTFGDYLMELWNPLGEGKDGCSDPDALRAARATCVAYLRPTGPLPIAARRQAALRHPAARRQALRRARGRRSRPAIGKVLGVLRPMWRDREHATVPLLKDGNVDKAKDILQTAPWSQAAFYRDKDAGKAMCKMPNAFSDAQGTSAAGGVIENVLGGARHRSTTGDVHIYNCSDFLPDPPYSAGYLAGVPWVLADDEESEERSVRRRHASPPAEELPLRSPTRPPRVRTPARRRPISTRARPARRCCRRCSPTRCRRSRAMPSIVRLFEQRGHAREIAARRPKMPYVEAGSAERGDVHGADAEGTGSVVNIPSVTGRATLGEHVAQHADRAARDREASSGLATLAAAGCSIGVEHVLPQTRDLGAVKLSLDYLVDPPVGELNIAFSIDARRILVPPRRVDRRAREPPAGADPREPIRPACTSAATHGSRI